MTANEQQLLNYALQNGIIDTSFITEQIKMQRKVEILKNHPYEIYQGNYPAGQRSQFEQLGKLSERIIRGFDRATGRYDTRRAANGKDKDYHTCS